MKKVFIIISAGIIGAVLVSALYGAYSHRRFKRAVYFAHMIENSLSQDARVSSLRVVPSTSFMIDIEAAVESTNMFTELRDRVIALNPPVTTIARLYVQSNGVPEDLGKCKTWIIRP
jgi:hypothetical protein